MRRLIPRKRWLLPLTLSIVVALAATFYMSPEPPSDAPRVLVSIDATIWHRLGFSRLTYARALREAGLRPVLVDFGTDIDPAAAAGKWLDGMQGLVLSGGGDVDPTLYGGQSSLALDVNPRRDEFELALLTEADRRGLPVLGICRGAQLINVYRGGQLGDFRADAPRYQRHHRLQSGHAVLLDEDSRLADIYQTTRLASVITYHGQFISEPGMNVKVVAWSPDGTAEAIEVDTDSPFGMLGVQWHAEFVPRDSRQAHLFLAFRQDADAYRDAKEATGRQSK